MIADNETNFVYFSKLFAERYPKIYQEIDSCLAKFDIGRKLLTNTKDIWARDYMPIQVSKNKFIEYRYDPDYLQGEYKDQREIKSYPGIVCSSNGIKTIKSDIILDGGNIVKSSNCVILTDKVVRENRFAYAKEKLIKELENIFEIDKIVLIPWDKREKLGHADGVLKFIDNETVLVGHIYKYDTQLQYRLKRKGLKIEFLNFKIRRQDKRNWAYINFLQTQNLILLPKFNVEEDEQAMNQIANYYPEYAHQKKITQIDMTEIIKWGGALNCISWNIKK